jgi:hypothetical protein
MGPSSARTTPALRLHSPSRSVVSRAQGRSQGIAREGLLLKPTLVVVVVVVVVVVDVVVVDAVDAAPANTSP